MKTLLVVVGIVLVLSSFPALALDKTGVVHVINVNKHPGWNGVLFQLEDSNGSLITIDPDCGNNTWGYFKVENDLDKAILTTLITSKTTNSKVRVGFSGCLAPPDLLSSMPQVQWVDLGIRN